MIFSLDIWEFWFLFFKSSSWSFKLLTVIKTVSKLNTKAFYKFQAPITQCCSTLFSNGSSRFWFTYHRFLDYVFYLPHVLLSADILHSCVGEELSLFPTVLRQILGFFLRLPGKNRWNISLLRNWLKDEGTFLKLQHRAYQI